MKYQRLNWVQSAIQQGVLIIFLFFSKTYAQLPNTDLHTVYPPFGKTGSTVEVTISGKPLEDITSLRFNDNRITAAPLTTPADEIHPAPQPVKNKFVITIPESVPAGTYEVRALGYHGLSTARPFLVLPKEAKERLEESAHDTPEKALPIDVGDGIYGTIGGRSVEWFKLKAKKNQRYFLTVWAERVDSKMDSKIRIFDSTSRELDQNNDYFARDPMLDFTAPQDGEYTIAISDILYRGGGNTYPYRITVSQNPHIDFIWPPSGIPGTKQSFTIYGRNLPGGKPVANFEINGKAIEELKVDIDIPTAIKEPATFTFDTPRRAILPGFEYRIQNSNSVKIGFASAPVVLENSKASRQSVKVPVEIAGKFDQPGDFDTYRFTAEKDKTYWLEIYCDRHGVSADPVIFVKQIKDGKPTAIAENDDPPSFFAANNFDATNLNTNDPAISFTAEESGEYEAVIVNNSASGSPSHFYRLAVREPTHDFQLITTTEQTVTSTNGRAGYPAAQLVRKNGTVSYRVVALRQDGFDAPVTVSAEGLPAGVTAKPLILHGKNSSGFLTIKAAGSAKNWAGPIRIVGKSKTGNIEKVRTARNASLVWGAIFADSARVRSRLDLETVLSVTDQESAPCYIELASTEPLTVELRKELEVPVKVTDFNKLRKGNLTVQPHGLHGMLRAHPKVAIAEGKTEGILKINFTPNGNFKAEAGTFDFVLQGTGITKHRTNTGAIAKIEKEIARLKKLKEESATNAVLIKKIETAITAAEKNKKTAETTAKQTDTKFATCSEPITITVTEPEKK